MIKAKKLSLLLGVLFSTNLAYSFGSIGFGNSTIITDGHSNVISENFKGISLPLPLVLVTWFAIAEIKNKKYFDQLEKELSTETLSKSLKRLKHRPRDILRGLKHLPKYFKYLPRDYARAIRHFPRDTVRIIRHLSRSFGRGLRHLPRSLYRYLTLHHLVLKKYPESQITRF